MMYISFVLFKMESEFRSTYIERVVYEFDTGFDLFQSRHIFANIHLTSFYCLGDVNRPQNSVS